MCAVSQGEGEKRLPTLAEADLHLDGQVHPSPRRDSDIQARVRGGVQGVDALPLEVDHLALHPQARPQQRHRIISLGLKPTPRLPQPAPWPISSHHLGSVTAILLT
jgi:hypothetical protein